MVSDIRIDVSLPRHRKYKRLKRLLGESPMEYLVCFWVAVAEQVPDGVLSGWSAEDVEDAADWVGDSGVFFQALVDVGFIDNCDDYFVVHDWDEHQPWVSETVSRSDKARLTNMAKVFPGTYRVFRDAGREGISGEEYVEIKKSTDKITKAKQIVNVTLTPCEHDASAAFTPSPSPSPSPKPKSSSSKVSGKTEKEVGDDDYLDMKDLNALAVKYLGWNPVLTPGRAEQLRLLTGVFRVDVERGFVAASAAGATSIKYVIKTAQSERSPPQSGKENAVKKMTSKQDQALKTAERLMANGPPGG